MNVRMYAVMNTHSNRDVCSVFCVAGGVGFCISPDSTCLPNDLHHRPKGPKLKPLGTVLHSATGPPQYGHSSPIVVHCSRDVPPSTDNHKRTKIQITIQTDGANVPITISANSVQIIPPMNNITLHPGAADMFDSQLISSKPFASF